jgi:hypothetical protein
MRWTLEVSWSELCSALPITARAGSIFHPGCSYRQERQRRSHADVNTRPTHATGSAEPGASSGGFSGTVGRLPRSSELRRTSWRISSKLLVAAVLTAGAASFAVPAGAADRRAEIPADAAAPSLETVRWRGWGWAPGGCRRHHRRRDRAAQPWNWGYYGSYATLPDMRTAMSTPRLHLCARLHLHAGLRLFARLRLQPGLCLCARLCRRLRRRSDVPTARSGSVPTIGPRAPIWATTDDAIPVRDAAKLARVTAAVAEPAAAKDARAVLRLFTCASVRLPVLPARNARR